VGTRIRGGEKHSRKKVVPPKNRIASKRGAKEKKEGFLTKTYQEENSRSKGRTQNKPRGDVGKEKGVTRNGVDRNGGEQENIRTSLHRGELPKEGNYREKVY